MNPVAVRRCLWGAALVCIPMYLAGCVYADFSMGDNPGSAGSGASTTGTGGGNVGGGGNASPCVSGDTRACYLGEDGTSEIGLCKTGTQTCTSDGTWPSNCPGEVRPVSEVCSNFQGDEDCDGKTDEGCPFYIAGGLSHTCMLISDGTLANESTPMRGSIRCWGDNTYGQLGLGTVGNTSGNLSPTEVSGITDAVEISLGDSHTCARLADNKVKCWGDGTNGKLGIGQGAGKEDPHPVPDYVKTLTAQDLTALAIDLGPQSACAILLSETVACWGNGDNGQLGIGGGMNKYFPTELGDIPSAKSIARGGAHTLAVLNSGAAMSWGLNSSGQLGLGHLETPQQQPVSISSLNGVQSITAGNQHSCALMTDGKVQCWGYQLGMGGGPDGNGSPTPQLLVLTEDPKDIVIAIEAGNAHTCALMAGQTVICWGANALGQLGVDNGGPEPAGVTGITDAIALAAGDNHSCVVLSDGQVMCWGDNTHGQLGTGDTTNSPTPVNVVGYGD